MWDFAQSVSRATIPKFQNLNNGGSLRYLTKQMKSTQDDFVGASAISTRETTVRRRGPPWTTGNRHFNGGQELVVLG